MVPGRVGGLVAIAKSRHRKPQLLLLQGARRPLQVLEVRGQLQEARGTIASLASYAPPPTAVCPHKGGRRIYMALPQNTGPVS